MWRMSFNSEATFGQMAWPTLLTGPFMVMFFLPTIGLAMSSVSPGEEANAAGLSNFLRTLAGAFATSLVQTGWEDATRRNQTELAGAMTHGNAVIDSMTSGGVSHETATGLLTQLVSGQSVMLATLNIFAVVAAGFVFSACLIWMAPKPKGPIDMSGIVCLVAVTPRSDQSGTGSPRPDRCRTIQPIDQSRAMEPLASGKHPV
jgi:DHA2 family multidrug resistance protein